MPIDRSRNRHRVRADWLGDLVQDARFAARSLRRAPAFAATAIITVGVAIAANTTIFSFVNALLLEPLPYRQPKALVVVDAPIVGSIGEVLALRERTRSFADIGVYRTRSITLNDDHDAVRVDGVVATPNVISMLGVAPAAGTLLDASASRPGAGDVILLSHTLWVERFGGDRRAIGKFIMVDGVPFRIVGVMPPDFHFPSVASRFWIPMTVDRANIAATWAVAGGRFVARLKPGVSVARASVDVATVVPTLRQLNPIWDPGHGYGKGTVARPLQETLMERERPALLLLAACVIVVLLVACVNLANLMLARVTGREREFTVRAAVGGGRGRLVRQLLTESATIAVAGATFGVILALGAVHWGVAALPPGVVRTTDIHVSAGVLVFTGALAVMTGMAFGILPALRAAAGSAQSVLGTRGSSRETAHHRLSAALVAGEVALAVLLAITAGLLTRSFAHLRDLSPGFRTERVVSALISPPPASYKDVTRATAFYTNVLDRVSAMPGVTSAALVDRLPIAGPVYGMGARVQGQFEDAKRLLPTVNHVLTITPSYLSVFGIPVVQGRALDDGDRAGATPVVLVSQSLARRFWPKGEAVGKRIGYPYQSPWLTIVGVVPDVRIDSLRDTASMTVYVPFSQRTAFANSEMSIVVRTSAEPQAIANGLRDIVASIDRAVPVTRVRAMNDVVAQSVAKPRFTAFLVGGFALAALLLGATGIYGVMSYIVSQRAHEMGVRMALGATPTDIVRLVLGRGTLLAGAGAAVGCAMALVATRALRSLLFGVSATDPLTFFGAVSVFILVAVSASAFPARRATRADPVQSLRQD